jgi:hypothetical protein
MKKLLVIALGILLLSAACGAEEEAPPQEPAARSVFADALADFFADATYPPEWALVPDASHVMQANSHAIYVDVDGEGTMGVLATKWTTNVAHYLPGSSAERIYVQRVFLEAGGHVRPVSMHNIGVTPGGRLITLGAVDGQGISLRAYTLLGFTNGQFGSVKSLMQQRYGYWRYDGVETWVSAGLEDSHSVNYHTGEFWNRDIASDQPLTHAEFTEQMTRYGLQGTTPHPWELPDQTDAILG